RIVDFSAGVVFGVRGSIERVTPRVFLLSPAQVNIKVEDAPNGNTARDLFS
ncbi:cell division protein SepF, partial [Bifidobacteriaceae bacterium NR003]